MAAPDGSPLAVGAHAAVRRHDPGDGDLRLQPDRLSPGDSAGTVRDAAAEHRGYRGNAAPAPGAIPAQLSTAEMFWTVPGLPASWLPRPVSLTPVVAPGDTATGRRKENARDRSPIV